MKRGLVLGKFMPFHKGHEALIDFALKYCDELLVLICATSHEPIKGVDRLKWITETYKGVLKVKIQLLCYDDNELPNTSKSSKKVSMIWADYLKLNLPKIDIIFTSEPYGKYMSNYLNCEYKLFDQKRITVPVSATEIRNDPFANWENISEKVKPHYIKKVCLLGTESTGKTVLTAKLANFFNTSFVPEMAREILEKTNECKPHHLNKIALLHAQTINDEVARANKILFIDTDLNITKSYSKFLFKQNLKVPEWVEEANKCDLYFYLDTDAPYVQDGTRLTESERNELNKYHLKQLAESKINYELLQGDWDQKFQKAISLINLL